MQLVECFVRGKAADQQLCEDAVIATADFAGVVDGATDKSGRQYGGVLGGKLAAESVVDAFNTLDAGADATTCVGHLTRCLAERLAEVGYSREVEPDAPSAAFVAYSVARREVWRVGYCGWMSEGVCHAAEKSVDKAAAAARSALLHALLMEGSEIEQLRREDPGREMILALLVRQHQFRNAEASRQFGYGAIDGRSVPPRLVEVWSVPPSTEIVMATDGYPEIKETLAEAEDYLRSDLQADPLRIGRHASTKAVAPGNESFDDRAYIRIAT